MGLKTEKNPQSFAICQGFLESLTSGDSCNSWVKSSAVGAIVWRAWSVPKVLTADQGSDTSTEF